MPFNPFTSYLDAGKAVAPSGNNLLSWLESAPAGDPVANEVSRGNSFKQKILSLLAGASNLNDDAGRQALAGYGAVLPAQVEASQAPAGTDNSNAYYNPVSSAVAAITAKDPDTYGAKWFLGHGQSAYPAVQDISFDMPGGKMKASPGRAFESEVLLRQKLQQNEELHKARLAALEKRDKQNK